MGILASGQVAKADAAASLRVSPQAVAQLVTAIAVHTSPQQQAHVGIDSAKRGFLSPRAQAVTRQIVKGLDLTPVSKDSRQASASYVRLQFQPKGAGAMVCVRYRF